MKTLIKICGITNLRDAYMAADMGANAAGFVFYEASKRYITCEDAREIIRKLPPFLIKCGVFVDERWEKIMEIKDYCKLDRVQLYTDNDSLFEEAVSEIDIMAFRIRSKKDVENAKKTNAFPLLDSFHETIYGGSGIKFNWDLLKDFGRPYILAGGINIENVDEVLKLNPYAIDIASGVERSPGVKDPDKMAEIFKKIDSHRQACGNQFSTHSVREGEAPTTGVPTRWVGRLEAATQAQVIERIR